MKSMLILLFVLASAPAYSSTLDEIRSRGYLGCGISGDLAGFSQRGSHGIYTGFDVDYCRAIAAAIDVKEIHFIELTSSQRLNALKDKKIDVLSRTTTWTLSRDANHFSFVGTIFYDGEGFMLPRDEKIITIKDLSDKIFCIREGTITLKNLAAYFGPLKINYETKIYTNQSEVDKAYLKRECEVYVLDTSGLASIRSTFPTPQRHKILTYTISKEPLSPVVRDGDAHWVDIARWTLFSLIALEEHQIGHLSKDRVNELENEQKIFLDSLGSAGESLGLDRNWGYRIASAVGNYSVMFETHLGIRSKLKLDRGLNSLWSQGGLLYSPPFK